MSYPPNSALLPSGIERYSFGVIDSMRAARSPARHLIRHQTGFTLLEILTAMALFFMVAGILVSGVAQAIRVADQGATQTANTRDQAMRLAWFRETIGLTVLPPRVGNTKVELTPLIGQPTSIAGLSIAVPNSVAHGPMPYFFDIGFSTETGESELRLRRESGAPAVLARWRGSNGRFFYLDEVGTWQERWPVNASSIPSHNTGLESPLPKAVELRYGDPANSIVVAIQDRTIPPPPISELMK